MHRRWCCRRERFARGFITGNCEAIDGPHLLNPEGATVIVVGADPCVCPSSHVTTPSGRSPQAMAQPSMGPISLDCSAIACERMRPIAALGMTDQV